MKHFTHAAESSLNLAPEIAARLGHSYIGSEHLLLALVSNEKSIAARILEARGVTKKRLFAAAESSESSSAGSSQGCSASCSARLTPCAVRIIERSGVAAVRSGQKYIGTEHLLYAAVSDYADDHADADTQPDMSAHVDSAAVRLLRLCGASIKDIRRDAEAALTAPGLAAPSSRGELDRSGEFNSSNELRDGEPDSSSARQDFSEPPRKRAESCLERLPTLRRYGRDLTAAAREALESGELSDFTVIGREEETERMISILCRRSKNNPCLIGEPGVGKTALVEGLALRIASGEVPSMLSGVSIVALELSGMIAGAKYRGEFEERMKGIMSEAERTPELVLFIDELHTVIGAGAAEGAVDAANIIKPALARGKLRIIGATTTEEFRRHIESDSALERRFQPVLLEEPNEAEAERILLGLRGKYESFHRVSIPDGTVRAAVKLSARYIPDRRLPDKAIDLIDEAAAKLRIAADRIPPELAEENARVNRLAAEKERAILRQDFERAALLRTEEEAAVNRCLALREAHARRAEAVPVLSEEEAAAVLTAWTGIPVSRLTEGESTALRSLPERLRKRVLGQDEAIAAVCRTVMRSRTGLAGGKRPSGSFIFAGPTGVGKTELAKALAEALFGSEDRMIRLDMSEFSEKSSVSRLIGSPPGYVGYDDGGQLTERIRRRPYSVVLFDELEKAHPETTGILLQLLEDGRLTDSRGRAADFSNAVVIMTTNLGSPRGGEIGFSVSGGGEAAESEARMAELKAHFAPELLNRVDDIVLFRPLGRAELELIAAAMLRECSERLRAAGCEVELPPGLAAHFASLCDGEYGARQLRRLIRHEIEDRAADALIKGEPLTFEL